MLHQSKNSMWKILYLCLIFYVQSQEILHSFKFLNYSFDKPEQYQKYISNKHYMNCTIAGIKVDQNENIFLSIPRWKENVPATFVRLNTTTK